VREHDVARDEWETAAPGRPSQAAAFSAKAASDTGIIYPNARCPVCQSEVYFFEASNGGRVFFNTLWPEWDKHGCTIADTVDLLDVPPIGGTAATGELGIAAYVRPDGLTFAVFDDDGHAEYLSGEVDMSKRYLPHAWLAMDEGRHTGVLTLLAEDMSPIEVSVTAATEPQPMTDPIRRAISFGMKKRLIQAAKRITGLPRSSLVQTKPGYGTFVAGIVDDVRVIIIPIPVDQRWWHSGEELSAIEKYMMSSAKRISDLLDGNLDQRRSRLVQQNVVYVFDDLFGYVADSVMNRFSAEANVTFSVKETTRSPWGMEWRGLTNLTCVATPDAESIEIVRNDTTIEELLSQELHFCAENWPSEHSGRWRQIEQFFYKNGLGDVFGSAHETLRKAGWVIYHPQENFGGYFEVAYHPMGAAVAEDDHCNPVRLLLSLSTEVEGVCFLLDSEVTMVATQERLLWVKTVADVRRLVPWIKAASAL